MTVETAFMQLKKKHIWWWRDAKIIILAPFACFCCLLEHRMTVSPPFLPLCTTEHEYKITGQKEGVWNTNFSTTPSSFDWDETDADAVLEWEARTPTPIIFTFKSYRLVSVHTKRAQTLISVCPMIDMDKRFK